MGASHYPKQHREPERPKWVRFFASVRDVGPGSSGHCGAEEKVKANAWQRRIIHGGSERKCRRQQKTVNKFAATGAKALYSKKVIQKRGQSDKSQAAKIEEKSTKKIPAGFRVQSIYIA